MEEYVYLGCFMFGLLFTIVSVFFGHHFGGSDAHMDLGTGGHAEAGYEHSSLCPAFAPLIQRRFARLSRPLGIWTDFLPYQPPERTWMMRPCRLFGGLLISAAVLALFSFVFQRTQSSSEGHLGAMVGRTATVITPIPLSGVGEIAYVQGGSRYTAPAREQNGVAVANGQTVKIPARIANLVHCPCVVWGCSIIHPATQRNKMHTPSMFALLESLHGLGTVVLATVGLVFFLFLIMAIWASRYTKVGPNQVLVVSGHRHKFVGPDGTVQYRGFRIVKGGGTFVLPVLEKVDVLSLELLTIDVQTPAVYTGKGVEFKVDSVASSKSRGDDVSIATASEQVLSKSIDEIKTVATQTLERPFARAILGTMTVEDIYPSAATPSPSRFRRWPCRRHGQQLGLSIVSFTIRDISDSQRAIWMPWANRAPPKSNATPLSRRPKPTGTR